MLVQLTHWQSVQLLTQNMILYPIGMLQVLFPAGATGYPIEQHVDSAFLNILPKMQFYPCGCTPVNATSALVDHDESPMLNHKVNTHAEPQSKYQVMCISVCQCCSN